jgi:outer membrane protein OmpA-like peptidoglycan-associated protein
MGNFPTNAQIPKYTLSQWLLVLILLVASFFPAIAQPQPQKVNKKAYDLYNESMEHLNWDRFGEAEQSLLKALEVQPDFMLAHERLGYLYFQTRKYSQSKYHFIEMLKVDPNKSKEAFYYLARSCFYIQQFDSSEYYLDTYRKVGAINPKREGELKLLESSIVFAKEAIKHPVAFTPKPAGPGVNSADNEYFPALTADSKYLFFTRQIKDPGTMHLQEDILVSQWEETGWSKSISVSSNVNTPDANQGAHSISPDGRQLYFTICENGSGYGSCDIYVSKRVGNTWGKPVNLGPNINTKYKETQPCISGDGRSLYFVSSRPGGQGMLDIWVSQMQADGNWGVPTNLGPTINTPTIDERPYMHPDGQTLYFSSDGRPGFGDADIYYSRKQEGGWSEPTNLGYPINSYYYEGGIFVSLSGELAYFATDRFTLNNNLDIYGFEMPLAARPKKVTYITGTVKDKSTKKVLLPPIEFIDLATGQTTNLIVPDAQSGEFLLTLPTGINYGLSINQPGYLFYSYNFPIDKQNSYQKLDILLEPISSKSTVVLNNVFYETGNYKLKNESKSELDRLVKFLEINPTVKLEIAGHTDNVGTDANNLDLSQKRANEVVSYLTNAGIDKARLKAKGYGASKPLADNSNEAGRTKNRRTEVTIIE